MESQTNIEYKRNSRLKRSPLFWQDTALCVKADIDPDIFFSQRAIFYKEAIKLCGACAVKQQCLNSALSFPVEEDFGIRAGLNRIERLAMRKKAKGTQEHK